MTALALLTRYWREGLIGALVALLVVVVLVDTARLTRCKAQTAEAVDALDKTKADYRAAQANAAAMNKAAVLEVEHANAATTQEIQNDLTSQLAAARAAGAAYTARLRDQAGAARRPAGSAGVSAEADTAGSTADANREALVADDIRICSDNTVKVDGWRRWYEGLK